MQLKSLDKTFNLVSCSSNTESGMAENKLSQKTETESMPITSVYNGPQGLYSPTNLYITLQSSVQYDLRREYKTFLSQLLNALANNLA